MILRTDERKHRLGANKFGLGVEKTDQVNLPLDRVDTVLSSRRAADSKSTGERETHRATLQNRTVTYADRGALCAADLLSFPRDE